MREKKYKYALKLITHYEGFRSDPYRDAGGVLTVGYGRTTGKLVPTTREREREYVKKWLYRCDDTLNATIERPLTQYEMAALMSFIYNVGYGNFTKSTLRKKLINNQRYQDEFLRWAKVGNDVLPGLVKRRVSEYLLIEDSQLKLI